MTTVRGRRWTGRQGAECHQPRHADGVRSADPL